MEWLDSERCAPFTPPSRAASSAVNRGTTGSTCSTHGGGWHEERITGGETGR